MKTLKKIFPVAFAFSKSGGKLALGIIIHIAAMIAIPAVCATCRFLVVAISGLLGWLFVMTIILAFLSIFVGTIGAIINFCIIFVGVVLWLYSLTSLVMNILAYCKVFGSDEPKAVAEASDVTTDEIAEEPAEVTAEETAAEKAETEAE